MTIKNIFYTGSGVGAMILSFLWFFINISSTYVKPDMTHIIPIMTYYLFNGILLILIGFLSIYKITKWFKIILPISVIASIFVPLAGSTNLFMMTVATGLFASTIPGFPLTFPIGIILVPLFLIAVAMAGIESVSIIYKDFTVNN